MPVEHGVEHGRDVEGPDGASYLGDNTSGGFIDAFATSQADQVIQVSGTGTTKLKADVTGNYFGRVAFTGATPPASVTITNASGTPAVTLSNANTSVASFTAPATTTTLTFRLTVQGPGGPKTTDEVVSVASIAPPRANAGPAQSVLAGSTVTLDGSGSTGATPSSGRRPVAWRRRCPPPRWPSRPSRCRNPQPDVLTTSQIEFRTSKREWRIVGTASVVTGNVITIRLGSTLTGPVLGTASVDALGAWSLRLSNGPQPPASQTVSMSSSRGGVLLARAVTVRN